MEMSHFARLVVPDIHEIMQSGDWDALKEFFLELHPSDAAELLRDMPNPDVADIIRHLPYPFNVEIFKKLVESDQAEVVVLLGRREMARLIEQMAPDDRVDLLRRLPEGTIEALLPSLAQVERDDIRRLLTYREGTAGSLLTTEYASLSPDLTVEEALQRLRKIAPDRETIYYIYIVDPSQKVIGFVSLQDLVIAPQARKVGEIMKTNVISMNVEADQEAVAEAFKKYDFLAMPIVDDQERLVGIVTHDDVVDVLEAEHTEDVQKQGAVAPLEVPYFTANFWKVARSRGLWLAVIFVGEMLTGSVLRHFEATLQGALSLVYFIPLVISAGGNSGSQSATLITRALAVGEVGLKDGFRVFFREGGMGIFLGLFLGLIGFLQALPWAQTFRHALSVGLAIVGVVAWGAFIGAMLPLLFKKIRLDPAVVSAPFVASLVDVTGLLIYLTAARIILGI
ncbi:MAG: magnesium transporter [Planctomycetes bacterium]|nr:magnesium transporter [Planctomycetota bacterium]